MIKQNSLLTKADLSYIEKLKKALIQMDKKALKYPNDKTLTWLEPYHPNYEQYDKPDYKEEMIHCFIEDLFNGTTSYTYNIYHYSYRLTSSIFQELADYENNTTSQYLKLRMLDLLPQDTSIYSDLLKYAYKIRDAAFLLNLLQRGVGYQGVLTFSLLNEVSNYYKKLLHYNPHLENRYKANFVSHIKNSTICISDAELIAVYTSIFSAKDTQFIYDSFNIKKEDICLQVKTQALSIITLNLKELMFIHLGPREIMDISNNFYKDRQFPSFQFFKQSDDTIELIVESNALSEKKVVVLFEHLVQSRYHFQLDKEQDFNTLFSLMATINEKVDLDNRLSHDLIAKKSAENKEFINKI